MPATIKIRIALIAISYLFGTVTNAGPVELPVYGNWCGPGFPANGEAPEPIDIIDQACMLHDNRYTSCEQDENRLMCEAEADFELVDSLNNTVNILSREQLGVANNIGKYFSVQGPIKATTEHQKTLLMNRIRAASSLTNRAGNALSSLGSKLMDMGGHIVHTATEEVEQAVTGVKKNIGIEP